jgi:DNA polymerase
MTTGVTLINDSSLIMDFLNIASDYLKSGYHREKKPDLPLAYITEEPDYDSLKNLIAEINVCKNCSLCEQRTLAVPGEGVSNPLVMIIGEGPGADEDRAGRPFVGKAGQLLDKMLTSIGLSREKNCFITNMVKCRPPGNRDPEPEEISVCNPYLKRQITLLNPKIILNVGRIAAQNMQKTSFGINALRGHFTNFTLDSENELKIPLMSTFHPSAVLRNESLKRPAWEDLKLLRSKLESLESDLALL